MEKQFASPDSWRTECRLYTKLRGRLPLAEVLAASLGKLVLSYCGAPTLLAELERQGRQGFEAAPWRALARWLEQCHAACGELPAGGDLRDFLWDAAGERIVGLDLESYRPSALADCGGMLTAALLEFPSQDAGVRTQAAAAFCQALNLPFPPAGPASPHPAVGRNEPLSGRMSGVILAGGTSRRMGADKAGLRLGGATLLQLQAEKLRALGIQDILLSGGACPQLPGTRVIPDEWPGNGPLGGLHACLRAARNQACLVLSVDAPLVPAAALAHLCLTHRDGATVLRHGQLEEPLIAVYDSRLAGEIPALMREGRRSVRELARLRPSRAFVYQGPENLLKNCNTPEEFSEASRLAGAYAAAGISLTAFGLP